MDERLTVEVERAEREEVLALLREVSSYAADLYPPESRHGLDLEAYQRPEITLFIARESGAVRGCCACQLHGDDSAELKSMFVVPEARGRGIGRTLLATIEEALHGRVALLRLETGIKQDAALRLYEAAGFRRCGPLGSYRDDPLSVCMEKFL